MSIRGVMSMIAAVVIGAGCPGPTPQPTQPRSAGGAGPAPGPLVGETGPGAGPRYPGSERCHELPFHKTRVMDAANPNVVRIKIKGVAWAGWGTGFVVASPRADELLIVTNHHVVGGADQISALLVTPSGRSSELAGLEVVKEDHENDLVLLRAARLPGLPNGLYLSPSGPQLAEDVAAIGYPGGQPNVTFESGDISSLTKEVDGRAYIQTNANINPGSSGGPVVDACGAVVGVVTAIYLGEQRVGLIVNVSHVLSLYDRYVAPRDNTDTHLIERLAVFERSMKLGKRGEAAEIFSRRFLRERLHPLLTAFVKQAKDTHDNFIKELKRRGVDWERETPEEQEKALYAVLSPEQIIAVVVMSNLQEGRMSYYEGLQRFLEISPVLTGLFGHLTRLSVIEVLRESDKASRARVEIVSTEGVTLWDFYMEYEWGDWHVSGVQCLNCKR
jgi:hypothetical protein